VTVDGTAAVAGRDAYQLVIKPKGAAHSTVDSVRIAVDAKNGTPLKFTLNAKDGGKPVVEMGYTKVDFGKPAAETFRFKPPKGTDVTEQKMDEHAAHPGKHGKPGHPGKSGELDRLEKLEKLEKSGKGARPDMTGMNILGKGWGQVAEIKAPKGALSGMPGMTGQDGKGGGAGEGSGSAQGDQLLDSFTDKAKGDFGTGRVFSTRLVNALMTDDGTVYVGAVSKEGLIKAADAAR
jgi:hypothetical protein